ncbi:MAG: DUF4173 domain-containing protein [Clostridiaceae bacterium]|nr:DUF4173 domain-containing protein [Eubacteriales bacterium]
MERPEETNKEQGAAFPAYKPMPAERREYSAKQKLLLAVTLAMGIVFAALLWGDYGTSREFALPYAFFWAIYLVGYYVAVPDAKTNRAGWLLVSSVALLFLRYAVYAERTLGLINLIAIPLLLMLHAVVCSFRASPGCEGEYALRYLAGFFVKPFAHIPRFFGAIGAIFQKREEQKRSGVFLGLLIGLPLAVLVFSLLSSADSVLSYYAGKLFEGWSVSEVFWRTVLAVIVAFLFYSFLYGTAWEKFPTRAQPYKKGIEPSMLHTVIALLLAVYAVFGYVQFFYLTGLRGLPAGLTYSAYAVRGFNELLIVALINLGLFALTLRFEKEHRRKRAFLLLLLIATALVLYSGAARLILYIDAYALTMARILPFWFILFLAVAATFCAVRLYMEKFRLMRAVTAAFIAMYLILNTLNLDAMVAQSVLARARLRGTLDEADAHYLRYSLSSDAERVLKASKYKDQIYYDVEPGDLG